MYIIDKNKDYYDYLSSPNMYGTDKRVVLDRRGSTVIADEDLYNMVDHRSVLNNSFILIEYGFIQTLLKAVNIKTHEANNLTQFDSCDFEIVKTYKENKHYYSTPLSIRKARTFYRWERRNNRDDLTGKFGQDIKDVGVREEFFNLDSYANSILKETSLTSLFTPEEIWIELQTYISSLNNDEDKETTLTDVERAEKHGFDRVTSFRNPIK
jgi:hypothetical protein